MENILEYLPFLIPLLILQLGLMFASLTHVLRHRTYRLGNRPLWIILSLVTIIGPVLYFAIGKEDK